ncbi:hypothetical protein [Yoonia sp. 2307UL14-13]|uniref:hypothetical protein n=1 Tax=Yoonia sp. 2307UL14-13 TaxID=3126506 RepID=UPI0030B693DD
MTTDFIKYRTSLARRFQTITLTSTERDKARKQNPFSLNYLLSYSDGDFETFDVVVAKAALSVARRDTRQSGILVVERFLEEDRADLIKQVILGKRGSSIGSGLGVADRFLLGTPADFDLTSREKRECYDEMFRALQIRTPFDKKGMLRLLEAINPDYDGRPVNSFAQLSELIWEFVRSSWPLFEASVLHIPLTYFSRDLHFSHDEIEEHLELMRAYGLERLLGRLIVLQAVSGSASARTAVSSYDVLSECEYSDEQISELSSYFESKRTGVEKADLSNIGRGNPIQRATYLIIYLNESTGPFSFLERLIDVYNVDPSILWLIDWQPFLPLIEQTSDYHYTPEIVAMAAILSQEGVLDKAPTVKDLYIPTSANTDFFNYTRYCREELKMSPHRYFASFSKLPINVQSAVFEYMLSPGQMDSIANIFPSSQKIIEQVDKSYTVNALTIKLDCISYLKKRGLLKKSLLKSAEESTRQRLRQIKYETDTSEGRIRLSTTKLASTIMEFYLEEFNQVQFEPTVEDHRQSALHDFLEDRAYDTFSEALTQHICFESRVALDYLLSNLRHNFLRFKVESGIDAAFHRLNEDLTSYKSVISDTLEDYYRKWLTLYDDRSFFKGLMSQINDVLHEAHSVDSLPPRIISERIAKITKDRFDSLLLTCREVWMGEVRQEVIDLVKGELSFGNHANDTALEDAIETELGRVFEDAEGWLTVNNNPINREFGLRDLFLFESTNFSSARTRIKPLQVECYEHGPETKVPIFTGRDVKIPGHLFDAMVQLVQNLLENAFKYSLLPLSEISISVSIIDRFEDGISIEFRNNFDREYKDEVRRNLVHFNEKIKTASKVVADAPLDVGGSGLRRIYFEFFTVFGEDFDLAADSSEFSKDTFLVVCTLPHQNGFHDG